jgi:hypothetical protein
MALTVEELASSRTRKSAPMLQAQALDLQHYGYTAPGREEEEELEELALALKL